MDPIASRVAATYLIKNPHEDLKGEVIEASKIAEYEKALREAEIVAKRARLKANSVSTGKAKGMAKNEERKANKEARLAAARLTIAKQLKAKGLVRVRF